VRRRSFLRRLLGIAAAVYAPGLRPDLNEERVYLVDLDEAWTSTVDDYGPLTEGALLAMFERHFELVCERPRRNAVFT
jgi:hypothetical protein